MTFTQFLHVRRIQKYNARKQHLLQNTPAPVSLSITSGFYSFSTFSFTFCSFIYFILILPISFSLLFQGFLKHPHLLRHMSHLPFLYLPKTLSSQCRTADVRTQIARTYILTARYLYHFNSPFFSELIPRNVQPCHRWQ